MALYRDIPYKPNVSLAALIDEPAEIPLYPLVILLHGFTGWKEEEHLATLASDLAEHGIAAVRFDAPGSGESGGTFADDYRLTNYVESVGSVLTYACENFPVDKERIGIWGHSMGGFTALQFAVNHNDKLRAACACQSSIGKSGVSKNEEEAWRTTGWASFAHERFPNLDLPYDFYLDREQYDIRQNISELDMPLLLIAGSRDKIAPASGVKSIYDAASEPKEYREFNADHFYKKNARLLREINAATIEFFERSLSSPWT